MTSAQASPLALALTLLAALAQLTAPARPARARCCEVTLGTSGMLYYAALSTDVSLSLDATLRVPLGDATALAAGARLDPGALRGELFARAELAPTLGPWRPLAGLEVGVGSRGHYEDGGGIVGELAQASRRDLVPVYLALHTSPLRFALNDCWTLALADIGVGTHIAPAGRYVRLQLGLVTLGWTP